MTRLGAPDLTPTPLVEDLPPRDVERPLKQMHCRVCGRKGFTARTHPNHDERRAKIRGYR